VLSLGTGFIAPIIGKTRLHLHQFDASTGAPGPHDFAVRAVPFVRGLISPLRHITSIASPAQRS